MTAQTRQSIIFNMDTIHIDLALVDLVKSSQQIDYRGFSGPCRPNKRNSLPGIHRETDILYYGLIWIVTKMNVLKFNISFNVQSDLCSLILDMSLGVQNFKHTICGYHTHLQRIKFIGNHAQGSKEHLAELYKGRNQPQSHSRIRNNIGREHIHSPIPYDKSQSH